MFNPFAREQYVPPMPPEGKASEVPLPDVPVQTTQPEVVAGAPASSEVVSATTPDSPPVELTPAVPTPSEPLSSSLAVEPSSSASPNAEWSDGAKLMAEKGEAQARDKDTGA